MCNKRTNDMEVDKKLWVKLKSPSRELFEVIFDTENWQDITKLLEEKGFEEHEVINWKLKRVIFFS